MKRKRTLKKDNFFWMSFTDPDLPEGQRFLGVLIMRAHTFVEALQRSHVLKLNPGGQIASWEFPPEEIPEEKYIERLLNKADIIEMQGEAPTLGDLVDELGREAVDKLLNAEVE